MAFILPLTILAKGPDNVTKKKGKEGLKSSAASCAPATAVGNLDFNNAKARIENGGNLWQDRSNTTSAYEIPKGSGLRSIFAGALWMGGLSPNGQLKLAAVTFRSQGDDFWPGPLTNDGSASTESAVCNNYDRFYNAYKPDAALHKVWYESIQDGTFDEKFPDGYEIPRYFNEWPAHSNLPNYDYQLAPFQESNGGTENFYEPHEGDYPGYDILGQIECRDVTREVPLFGDTTIYWIFNDNGDIHTETGSEPIGLEVRAQAFAFADEGPVNNMTFYNYVIINQGSQTLEQTYFGQWVDADLGNAADDFVGCDVQRGLGYAYNGDPDDDKTGGPSPGYGITPPAIGVDFFQGPFQDADSASTTIPWGSFGLIPGDNPGPYHEDFASQGIDDITYIQAANGKGIPYLGIGIGYGDSIPDNERFGMRKFVYYNIGGGINGDPQTGQDYYNYLRGIWKDNQPMVYGGNGHPSGGGDPAIECDYMFPGNSDPRGWGTEGNTGVDEWTETTANNQPGDRRFMQSAGPFTLRPGDVNNITVGVVWARASSGDNLSSIDALKSADDIAQGLFDNCFQIFEGPHAPDVSITELDRELILYLQNGATSNNFGESYNLDKPEIPDTYVSPAGDTTELDKNYKFEGYLIYQLKNEDVSIADINNFELSRLAFQVDIENYNTIIDENGVEQVDLTNPIGQLVNYTVDPENNLPVPQTMVNGANKGIAKSFRVTRDLFATGSDNRIVNNKPYYFIAIAYAYNNYFQYDPISLFGQDQQFVSSRTSGAGGSISSVTGIPHKIENQFGGTEIHANYGDALPVTRIEGVGNAGVFVKLTKESEEAIMDGAPWYANELTYEPGQSPLEVKVIDPINLISGSFELKFTGGFEPVNFRNEKVTWMLINLETGDTVRSNNTISIGGEQIIPEWGISLSIKQPSYVGSQRNEKSTLIGASITYEDPTKGWLTGVKNVDGEGLENWIASGNQFDGTSFIDNPVNRDLEEEYEGILEGTWAPFALVRDTVNGPINPNVTQLNSTGDRRNRIANSPNVDIIITNDKSKWTRVPVLEMSYDPALAEGNVEKQFLRDAPSRDKNFKKVGDDGYNDAEGTLNGAQPRGMSWFPGYAIDVITGERLNMAFGEDSWLRGENGNDMIWNPTERLTTKLNQGQLQNYVFGGKHFVFVFKNQRRINEFEGIKYDSENNITTGKYQTTLMGAYDQGQFLYESYQTGANALRFAYWSSGWVGFPLMEPGFSIYSEEEGLNIPTETRISMRLSKRFEPYVPGNNDTELLGDAVQNQHRPMYRFATTGFEATRNDASILKDNLETIRVVPNPYYAYSPDYELDRLETKVKFTNLPERATISIYTVDGSLVRQFNKSDETTIVEWDIKNDANIPLSSGMYLIHIEVPGVGERVIKWYAAMRKVDLQNL